MFAGVAVEVAEVAGHAAQLADPALAHERLHAQPLRMRPHHERFLHLPPRAVAHLDQPLGSSTVRPIGFSQSTCLPASSARIVHGTCR